MKRIDTCCGQCGKKISVNKKAFNESRNKNKKYFCDRLCSDLFKGKKILFKCDFCAKDVIRPKHEYDEKKQHFCSRICSCKRIGSSNLWGPEKRKIWSERAKNLYTTKKREPKNEQQHLKEIKNCHQGLCYCNNCGNWFVGWKRKYCSIKCSSKHVKIGGFQANSTKVHRSIYNGQQMDSGAERFFAVKLDEWGVLWLKNSTTSFVYCYQGKLKKYYPDFFLPQLNLWVEIKGKKYVEDWLPDKLQSVKDAGQKILLVYSFELKEFPKVMARMTGLEPALCPS